MVRDKPLQTGKFVAILLAVVLAIAGFFRLIDARVLVGDPLLGDGQLLALVLLPLVSLVVVTVVFLETLVGVYRGLRTEAPLGEQAEGRTGYLLLRVAEAGLGVLGVLLVAAAVPPLLASSTPAPAGVGLMLLLFVVGLGILLVSFVRSSVELFVLGASSTGTG